MHAAFGYQYPRVLIVGDFDEGALGLYYDRAFTKLGWRTSRYDAWRSYARTPILMQSRALRRALRPMLWGLMGHEVAAKAREAGPDLVLVVKGAFLSVGAVHRLKQCAGVAVVNVYPDSPYDRFALRPDAISVLAQFDQTYIWGRYLIPRMQQDGVISLAYLPFAHDPIDYAPHQDGPPPECGRHHAVVFIGQYHRKREEWLAALEGHDVGVWGLGWARSYLRKVKGFCVHQGEVRGVGTGGIYARSRVALNILHQQNESAHNMRTFEIPPCQTVMVTEASEEIAGFFPPGESCLDAATPADLRRQVDRVLGDPSLAAAVAESGSERGRRHTYVARVETILQDLGLPVCRRTGEHAAP